VAIPTLYIEFDDSFLFCARIRLAKTTFIIEESVHTPLVKNEISQGIIFNQTRMLNHLNQALTTLKLTSPWTIICIPTQSHDSKVCLSTYVLQISLSFCKNNLKIYKIISNSLVRQESL
jgi:hypothetical protein